MIWCLTTYKRASQHQWGEFHWLRTAITRIRVPLSRNYGVSVNSRPLAHLWQVLGKVGQDLGKIWASFWSFYNTEILFSAVRIFEFDRQHRALRNWDRRDRFLWSSKYQNPKSRIERAEIDRITGLEKSLSSVDLELHILLKVTLK